MTKRMKWLWQEMQARCGGDSETENLQRVWMDRPALASRVRVLRVREKRARNPQASVTDCLLTFCDSYRVLQRF
jgi:hypothetical protein